MALGLLLSDHLHISGNWRTTGEDLAHLVANRVRNYADYTNVIHKITVLASMVFDFGHVHRKETAVARLRRQYDFFCRISRDDPPGFITPMETMENFGKLLDVIVGSTTATEDELCYLQRGLSDRGLLVFREKGTQYNLKEIHKH